jgi:hypothetical protein
MHVHLLVRDATSYRPDVLGENGANAVLRSISGARKMLLAGFTTVLDMGQLHRTPDLLAVSMARASDMRSASPAGTWTPRCTRACRPRSSNSGRTRVSRMAPMKC